MMFAVQASNILLNHETVILGDFGIAAKLDRGLNDDGSLCGQFGCHLRRKSYVGTPVWMAPEVIEQCCG